MRLYVNTEWPSLDTRYTSVLMHSHRMPPLDDDDNDEDDGDDDDNVVGRDDDGSK